MLNENGHWVVYQHVDRCAASDRGSPGSDYSFQPPTQIKETPRKRKRTKTTNKMENRKSKFPVVRSRQKIFRRKPRSAGYAKASLNLGPVDPGLLKARSSGSGYSSDVNGPREFVLSRKRNSNPGKI